MLLAIVLCNALSVLEYELSIVLMESSFEPELANISSDVTLVDSTGTTLLGLVEGSAEPPALMPVVRVFKSLLVAEDTATRDVVPVGEAVLKV